MRGMGCIEELLCGGEIAYPSPWNFFWTKKFRSLSRKGRGERLRLGEGLPKPGKLH